MAIRCTPPLGQIQSPSDSCVGEWHLAPAAAVWLMLARKLSKAASSAVDAAPAGCRCGCWAAACSPLAVAYTNKERKLMNGCLDKRSGLMKCLITLRSHIMCACNGPRWMEIPHSPVANIGGSVFR